MGTSVQAVIYRHLKTNWFLYTVILVFFIAGVTVGAYGLNFLSPDQTTNLNRYLDGFLNELNVNQMSSQLYLYKVLKESLFYILSLYVLGLTIVGFPIILGLIFIKGFKLGFAVGFLIQQKAIKGIIFALLSILPQNLLYIPVVIITGVTSLGFSFLLLKALLFSRRIPLPKYFVKYTFYMGLLALVLIGAGFLEAYVTPVFMRAIVIYIS